MGILCEPCTYNKNKINESFNEYNDCTMPTNDFYLPKETIERDVDENNENIITPEPPSDITPLGNCPNTHNKKSNLKKNIIETNDENINQKKKSVKIEIPNKLKKQKDSEEEILQTFSRRKKTKLSQTVKDPKDLKNKSSFKKNPKKKSSEKNVIKINVPDEKKNKENCTEQKFDETKQEVKKFIRKAKRSTTIVDRSKISQQMCLAEMNLIVSNESLVMHQKGKPTERYRRGKLIGNGSFGSVYEAKNLIFNNLVAMKIIAKKEKDENEDLNIMNEINILTQLSHPNIVKIYEFFDSKNFFYLITEFCKCGELFSYIKMKFSENQLAVLFYQVFSGLCYLHENKILHRDLKLENILISEIENDIETGEKYFWIKIIDFGTSKIFEKNKKEKLIVGSSYYIAPEVLEHNYNEKCDIWSAGVILYMTLVGKAPFDAPTDKQILEKIKNENYNKNEEKLLEYSDEVQDLLSKLLEKNVNKRLNARETLEHPWFKKFNGRKLFSNFKKDEIQKYIDNCLNYYFTSKIQSLVIAFLVHNLPNTESSKIILKLFLYFNKSGNCKLTKEELINGLSEFRDREEVIERVNTTFMMLDNDNNGYIEFEEFLRACIDKKEILTEDNMKFAFKFLDKNDTGTLDASKIMEAFLTKPNPIIESAFHNTLLEVYKEGDGIVDYEHFKIIMMKTMEK